MKIRTLLLATLLTAILLPCAAATQTTPISEKAMTDITKNADRDYLVTLVTNKGPIRLRLYDEAPLHSQNLVHLVADGSLDSLLFHRVIKDFMIQGGDPASKHAEPGQMLGGESVGEPIDREILFPQRFHKYGALAAARTGDYVNPRRQSSGSQFYIVTSRMRPTAEQIVERMKDRRQELFAMLWQSPEFRQNLIGSADSITREQAIEWINRLYPVDMSTADFFRTPQFQAMLAEYQRSGGAFFLDEDYTVYGEIEDPESAATIEAIQTVATDRSDRPLEDVRILSTSWTTVPKKPATAN